MKDTQTLYNIKAAQFQAVELPIIKEVRGKQWMKFGAENLFPQQLIELYNTSAMHATAVNAINDAINGQGIINYGDEYINLDGETINDVFEKISMDYILFGG